MSADDAGRADQVRAARQACRGLVTHPGSNHLAYHLVAALQQGGYDAHFETSVFWTGRGMVARLLRLLPAGKRAALAAGALGILNQVIGHIDAGLEVFAEEARRAPEFAETLPVPPQRAIAICRAEALEADRVIVPSDYVRDTMVARGVAESRIFVLPYGVDVERFRPGPPRDEAKFRVLFVDALSQRNGIN